MSGIKCNGSESGHHHIAILYRAGPCPLCACFGDIEQLRAEAQQVTESIEALVLNYEGSNCAGDLAAMLEGQHD